LPNCFYNIVCIRYSRVIISEKQKVNSIEYNRQFIVKIDISVLEDRVKGLRDEFDNVNATCNCGGTSTWKGFALTIVEKIKRVEDKFEHILFKLQKRNKRNIFGTILSWLTVVLTNSEKMEIEEKIRTLRETNEANMERLYENTKIMYKSIGLVNSSIKDIEMNSKEIKNLKKYVEEKAQRIDMYMEMSLRNDLLGLLKVNIENEISELNECLEDIEEAINDE